MTNVPRQKLKNITIALPEVFVDNLEKIQNIGMIPSRSEGIRLAIREFLQKEVYVCELMGYSLNKEEKPVTDTVVETKKKV